MASTPSSFRRHLSTSRPLFQEADAPSPAPQGMASLAADINRFKQQQAKKAGSEQQEQQQSSSQTNPLGAPPQSALQSGSGILGSLGTSSSSSAPGSWASTADRLSTPWSRHRTNSIVPKSATTKAVTDLGLDMDPVIHRPDSADLDGQAAMQLVSERPVDVKYRLRPVIGRTVELGGKTDVARALALLNMKCAVNKVKLDFNKQKFHERPGLKKKRLRRERWRVRFKGGFKATCARVRDLAQQGW